VQRTILHCAVLWYGLLYVSVPSYGMPSPLSISRIQEQLFSKKYLSCVIATTAGTITQGEKKREKKGNEEMCKLKCSQGFLQYELLGRRRMQLRDRGRCG
jgi:hypothetical protein